MDKTDLLRFTKSTETLITPKTVGGMYGRAEMLGKLPLRIQKWIVGRGNSSQPDMGFVVEPWSFFLS